MTIVSNSGKINEFVNALQVRTSNRRFIDIVTKFSGRYDIARIQTVIAVIVGIEQLRLATRGTPRATFRSGPSGGADRNVQRIATMAGA